MEKPYELHDVVEMKKPHPCGTNRWEIIRLGADIRINMYRMRPLGYDAQT